MSEHTPGPWRVIISHGRSITRHQIKEPRNNLVVAFTSGHGMSFRDAEDTANAHLIAAAPDLLKMVGEAKILWELRFDYHKAAVDGDPINMDWVKAEAQMVLDKMDAAIAAAEGKS